MEYIFGVMILSGLVAAGLQGLLPQVPQILASATRMAIQQLLLMTGIVSFWMGVGKLAKQSGLMAALGKRCAPLLRPLFSSIPPGHPALGAVVMSFLVDLFGLDSAATPFGIQAMTELQKLNPSSSRPSADMQTFLLLNIACFTLFPVTTVALRAAAGAASPGDIVGPVVITTGLAATAAIIMDRLDRILHRGE